MLKCIRQGATLFLFLTILLTPFDLLAQNPISESFSYAEQIGGGAFETSVPIQQIIVSLINVVLSFTSIIFTGVIMYGGFLYQTSHVNEDERDRAVATLRSGVIGIAFIIFSMSISKFVLTSVSSATGGTITALTF